MRLGAARAGTVEHHPFYAPGGDLFSVARFVRAGAARVFDVVLLVREQGLTQMPYLLSTELGMTYRVSRLPYGIRAIPDFAAPGNTAAYYMPGSPEGTARRSNNRRGNSSRPVCACSQSLASLR